MLPVQICIVSPQTAVTLTIENISFALRRGESSKNLVSKVSNYCEDVRAKSLPTILDLLMIQLKNGVPQICLRLFQVVKHLLHALPSQVDFKCK